MRALVLALAAGCSEYGINGDEKPVTGEPDPPTSTPQTPSTTEPTDEAGTCDVQPAPAGTVPIDPTCDEVAPPEILDPWDLVVEWQWTASGTELGVIVMPAVGNLTDDDGDGRITDADTPDVAFTTWGGSPSRLVALNGADGTEIFAVGGFDGNAGVTIADVTGDGWPEVVAYTADRRIAAVDGAGAPVWTSEPVNLSPYPQPTVADLDNDGDVEVVFDVAVVEGGTGAVITTISGITSSWRTPAVGDIDLDGLREIVIGNVVVDSAGNTWTNPGAGAGNFAAIADVDGDPEGEVLFVSGSTLYVHDADGTSLATHPIFGTNPGPPAVADFDGDGAVEIAIPANTTITVYELDGTPIWSSPIQDVSGLAGCSGYDVDGDGAYEVLFADETDLRIYDGRTGAVLYQNGTHDSGTVWEYPVIADADNDGSAEILVASNSGASGYRGVTMFGHAGSGWSKSGPTWGTHDFAVTNLLADGTVPTGELPSWQVHNTFRARPTVDVPGEPDPFLTVGDPCVTRCTGDGVIQIPWQVGNAGGPELPAGLRVVLLAVAASGDEREVASDELGPVAAGEVLAGGVFEVPGDTFAPTDRAVLRVEGGDADCHPGDTEVDLPPPCG